MSRIRSASFSPTSRTLGARTPADFERLAQLRKMQKIALGLLLTMAVIFVISFALQDRYPWLSYVRAASEGGMVGAIADWFAVTALFRYPLGIKIPHTNLIAAKKDEIGAGLGEFIEDNFLSDEVVHEKLTTVSGSRHAGEWLTKPENAQRISEMTANAALGALTVLSDSDVQELIESLVRRHIVEPSWSPTLSRAIEAFVAGGHEEAVLDFAAERAEVWLEQNPEAFQRMVSSRLPTWLPGAAQRFLDGKVHAEAIKFTQSVQHNPEHPFRVAARQFLSDLARDLQAAPELHRQVEDFKHEVFDSPRIRSLAESTWLSARNTLEHLLREPSSELRTRMTAAFHDFGVRLLDDPTLQYKIDVWVMNLCEHLVHTYRSDIAQVITDTVQRWDASEAAEKIELQVGKDLQFIRINGTVVGALAGLVIYTFADLVISPLTSLLQ